MTVAVGTQLTITAGTDFFDESSIGRQIWKKYLPDGTGGGRIRITQVNSATEAIGTVLVALDNDDDILSGNWYFTSDEITGLDYLEGETVRIIADGGNHSIQEVNNGRVQLDFQVSKAIVGYGYTGRIIWLNLENSGGASMQSKARNVWQVVINMLNSFGFAFGTTPYNIERIPWRSMEDYLDRPPPPQFGNRRIIFGDETTEEDKRVVIVQDQPLPCTILSLDIYMSVTDND